LTFGLVAAACCAAYGPFVAGLLLDTTASFFKDLSMRPATLRDISMLFWNPHPFLNAQRLFIGGGLIGAIIVACTGGGRTRRMALGLLLTEACFVGIGGLQFVRPFWFGPAFWYFEGFLFCYLAIFLVGGIYVGARFLAAVSVASLFKQRSNLVLAAKLIPITGAVFAGLAAGYVVAHGSVGSAGPYVIPYPQAETVITKILKDEISLKSERRFRGRVADFFGRSLAGINDYQIWNQLRHFALHDTGNMHDGAGLWQDAIPTLFEYNPLMTPGYFVFTRRFFTRPQDIQTRNWVQMRHIDPRLLATIGVRYVVTDAPFDGEAVLRSKVPIRVTDVLRKALGSPDAMQDFALHLYEIPRPNLGQYSPTEIIRLDRAADILDALASPDFDAARSMVTGEALPDGLLPARLEEFTVGRGDFHVRAASAGRSILLLPIEFSNCLTLTGAPASAHLFRADLVLTGLIFEQAVDLRFSYFTGPFANSTCRLRDRSEFERLDIANAFRGHREFLP
jgi:hypothetical protein